MPGRILWGIAQVGGHADQGCFSDYLHPSLLTQILERWLWEGVLDDPHAEFMVQESKVGYGDGCGE